MGSVDNFNRFKFYVVLGGWILLKLERDESILVEQIWSLGYLLCLCVLRDSYHLCLIKLT